MLKLADEKSKILSSHIRAAMQDLVRDHIISALRGLA